VPKRIEVYDNSHIQGSNAVGAMIVAGPDGFAKPVPQVQHPLVRGLTPGDDYAMMREVLQRRFKRLLRRRAAVPEGDAGAEPDDDSFPQWPDLVESWPDLVLIDGGQGQLNAAREVLRRAGAVEVRWWPSPRGRTAMPAAKPSSCRAATRSSCRRAIRCCILSSGCATRRIAS
jgi:excinuclease ABC subunit C